MNRQKYNLEIYQLLINRGYFRRELAKLLEKDYPETCKDDIAFFMLLSDLINDFPDQRFGQIICNYIVPDYRDNNVCETTKYILGYLFPGNPDPFFEESEETYDRLVKDEEDN